MSGTRHAPPGGPLRQERWASSADPLALNASLVAVRMDKAQRRGIEFTAEETEIIWAIQQLSHEDRGLKPLASELLEHGRIGTRSMMTMGCEPGRIYNAEEVRKVRGEWLALPGLALAVSTTGSQQLICANHCIEPVKIQHLALPR